MPKSSEKNASAAALNGAKDREAPGVVAPSSRVNVAFPFSQIKLEEPSKELAELAALVFDLVGAMAEWVPEDRLEELRMRAQVSGKPFAERRLSGRLQSGVARFDHSSPSACPACTTAASKSSSGSKTVLRQ